MSSHDSSSPRAIGVLSPAKINLFLHITGRREDGYHNLQTIFQLVSLYDEMIFEPASSDQLLIEGLPNVPTADNLVFRAMSALHPYRKTTQGYSIRLIKHIPTGAGLGGGSSNAATTLLILNQLWHCGLSAAQLASIGAGLGADVPVFVLGETAWAEGIGEQLSAVDLPPARYAIIKPDCFISTQALFSQKTLTRNLKPTTFAAYQHDPSQFANVFEPLVLKDYPAVAQAFEYLQPYGQPHLTGTGACVFVELASDLSDDQLQRLTHNAPGEVFLVDTLEQSPVIQLVQQL